MIEDTAIGVKLLILDVDGVMTDGRIIISDRGEEIKCFNARDGQGLKLLMNAGIEVAIITGRRSGVVEFRAKELGIGELFQGVKDKGTICAELIKRKKLRKNEVCCMGDDIADLPVFNQAGVAVAVADAVAEVRYAANFVTRNRGGNGAVREVCELILKAQGKWPDF